MRCLIIDDDIASVKILSHYVELTEGIQFVECYTNPLDALNYLRKDSKEIDFLLMDVQMPGLSGLEMIEIQIELPKVILLSALAEYAVKAFDFHVVDFLLKPIEYKRFLMAIERLTEHKSEQMNSIAPPYLFVKEENTSKKINPTEIIWIQALGDYIQIQCSENKYTLNSTMKEIEYKLSKFPNFVRIHRSYIVNLDYITSMDYTAVVTDGNKPIPIGDKYRKELLERVEML